MTRITLRAVSHVSRRTPQTNDASRACQAARTIAPSYTAPEVIADGIEARLIEAEAAFQANNYGGTNGTLAILNSLRSNAGLAALPAATTAQAQVDQLFTERAYWLFGTAHRLGDLRRLVREYQRNPETVFPTGTYFKGDKYGTEVNLPIPQEEQANSNFNRSACDITKA